MALDPQAQRLLDVAKGLAPVETLSVQEARARFIEAFRSRGEPERVWKVQDRVIQALDGEISIRVYTPRDGGPHPVLAYFHGGGGVVGSLDTHDALCRMLANAADCIVAAVDYRLAPEHKYPAGLNDCFAATRWLVDHAATFHGDPSRVAVGGDSAGASLAAGVALMARERGGPDIVLQLLFYPMMDHLDPPKPSHEEHASGYFLTLSGIKWFLDHYLPPGFDRCDPYLFPLQCEDLRSLPPAFILTAEYDPLRDDGRCFAEQLQQAGVPVYYRCVEGMMHGFTVMHNRLNKARAAIKEAMFHMKALLE